MTEQTEPDMTDPNEPSKRVEVAREYERVNVFAYFDVLLKWKRFLIVNLSLTILLSGIVVFLLPQYYKSTASILPPKGQGMSNPLSGASTLLKSISGVEKLSDMLSHSPGVYNYLAILKSRSSMEAVVKKFDLVRVYDVKHASMEEAIKELESNVSFDVQPEENITIEVLDKDPQRAANIANYFVDMLNEISIKLGTQEARQNREFIEKRVTKVYEDLRTAEDQLMHYQEKSGMLIVPDENSSGISAIAELYALKAKKELEKDILERTTSADNPALMQLRIELQEVEKKVKDIPEIGVESLRLYRQVAIQQKILEYVLPLYEQAKVDEQKDIPVILVLDKAIPAERHDRPKRMIIVLSVAILALLLQSFMIFLMEAFLARERGSGKFERKLDQTVTSIARRYRVK